MCTFQMQWWGTVRLWLWCTSGGSIRGKLASVSMDKLKVRTRNVLVWWCSQPGSKAYYLIIKLKRYVPHFKPQSNGTGPNNSNVVAGNVFGDEKNAAVICRVSYWLFIIFLPEKQYLSQAKKTVTHHVYVSIHSCVGVINVLKKIPATIITQRTAFLLASERVRQGLLFTDCVILSKKLNFVTFQDGWWVRISIIR